MIFEEPIKHYQISRGENFRGHWLAQKFRHDYPELIKSLVRDSHRYKIEGSPGKGNWTHCPWIAILDKLVTTSPQIGYYPVFVFTKDMEGVYFSLNQGVSDVQNNYRAKAKDILKVRANDFRAQLGDSIHQFSTEEIKLGGNSSTVKLYESGNIISKLYPSSALPGIDELRGDIDSMLDIYNYLVYNDRSDSATEDSITEKSGYENFQNLRLHYRIERNQELIKHVKKIKGYVCEACDFDFEEKYGSIGINFIEAHHLTPVSQLKGLRIKLSAQNDFSVLCSNCHRMIHRLPDGTTVKEFRKSVN